MNKINRSFLYYETERTIRQLKHDKNYLHSLMPMFDFLYISMRRGLVALRGFWIVYQFTRLEGILSTGKKYHSFPLWQLGLN